MKKKISVFMASLIALGCIGMAGCNNTGDGGSGEPYVPQNLFPTYADDKVMMIGGWDAPINTLEDYQFAKDMGLTAMFIDEVFVTRGSQEYFDVLGYCEEVGLEAILTLGNAATSELAKDSWAADKTDYSQYPAVKAINYWDEPHRQNLDRIAQLVGEHVAKYGNKIDVYVNHYPNTSTHAFGGLSYFDFLKEYSEKVLLQLDEDHRWLSADIYPLLNTNGSTLRATWLSGIEALAVNAKNYNAHSHFFIQSTEHWNYRRVSEEDIRWQFFVNMAFGIEAFTYFTYRDSQLDDFSNSCVSSVKSCVAHDEYYWAQTVNREIAAFDNVYLSFDWNGTMPIIGTKNEGGTNSNYGGLKHSLTEVECLKSATATQDALIGQFKDKDGNDGLIVTNFNDPYYGLKNKVTLEFKNADRVRVYNRGEYKDYMVLDNKFEFTLGVGDGAFLIPMAD